LRIIADRSERCSWPPAVKILVPSARSPYLFPRGIHVQGYVSRQRWCVSPIRHLVHPRTEPNLPSRRTAWIRSVTSLCRPLSIGPEPTRSSTPLTASPDPARQESVFPESLKALKDADPEIYELVQKEKLRQM